MRLKVFLKSGSSFQLDKVDSFKHTHLDGIKFLYKKRIIFKPKKRLLYIDEDSIEAIVKI